LEEVVSKVKHENATVVDFDGPFFPEVLERIGNFLENSIVYNIPSLTRAAKKVPGFVKVVDARSNDGYNWYFGVLYSRYGKEVLILIPWSMDFECQDGTQADRSFAVYTTKNADPSQILTDFFRAVTKEHESLQTHYRLELKKAAARHYLYYRNLFAYYDGDLNPEDMRQYKHAKSKFDLSLLEV
jgi:hypothetical protein